MREIISMIYVYLKMSNLQESFGIPINTENHDFVKYPYLPYQPFPSNPSGQPIDPRLMTIARWIDIKTGMKCDETHDCGKMK